MKKTILLSIFILLYLSACTENKGDVHLKDKQSFTGVIKEVNMNNLMVLVDENQEEYKSSDILSVSLDYKDRDRKIILNRGEPVRVYYNGMILESYPGQVTEVYKIEKIK